jgi:predicted nucleic acid-binding protein
MVLCDTNILIELHKANPAVEATVERIGRNNVVISDVVRAELFFGAKNKVELQKLLRGTIKLSILPSESEISSLAVVLVVKYCLSHKLHYMDALIAAAAIRYDIELYTLNVKDFIFIPEVQLFQP